jgi:hypothetical protein
MSVTLLPSDTSLWAGGWRLKRKSK